MISRIKIIDLNFSSIKIISSIFPKYPSIYCVQLFGSVAAGNHTPLSDIDICYFSMPDIEYSMEADIAEEIRVMLKTDDVDFVSFFKLPVRVRHGILSTGKILYLSDEEKFCGAKESTIREYLDFKYYLDEYDACFKERLLKGTFFK